MSTLEERTKILQSMFQQITYEEQTQQVVDLVKNFSYNQRMRIIEDLFGDQNIIVDKKGNIVKHPSNTIINYKK